MLDRFDIAYLADFIEPSDLAYFQKYCLGVSEWSDYSDDHYIGNMLSNDSKRNRTYSRLHGHELILDTTLLGLFSKYSKKIQESVHSNYKIILNNEEKYNCFNFYGAGDGVPLHGDEGWPGFINKTPNGFYPITHGVIAYITDNYSGGELVIPWYGKRYKPKAGSLIIIPSGNGNEHLVEPVESGERWIWSTFWAEKDDNTQTAESIR